MTDRWFSASKYRSNDAFSYSVKNKIFEYLFEKRNIEKSIFFHNKHVTVCFLTRVIEKAIKHHLDTKDIINIPWFKKIPLLLFTYEIFLLSQQKAKKRHSLLWLMNFVINLCLAIFFFMNFILRIRFKNKKAIIKKYKNFLFIETYIEDTPNKINGIFCGTDTCLYNRGRAVLGYGESSGLPVFRHQNRIYFGSFKDFFEILCALSSFLLVMGKLLILSPYFVYEFHKEFSNHLLLTSNARGIVCDNIYFVMVRPLYSDVSFAAHINAKVNFIYLSSTATPINMKDNKHGLHGCVDYSDMAVDKIYCVPASYDFFRNINDTGDIILIGDPIKKISTLSSDLKAIGKNTISVFDNTWGFIGVNSELAKNDLKAMLGSLVSWGHNVQVKVKKDGAKNSFLSGFKGLQTSLDQHVVISQSNIVISLPLSSIAYEAFSLKTKVIVFDPRGENADNMEHTGKLRGIYCSDSESLRYLINEIKGLSFEQYLEVFGLSWVAEDCALPLVNELVF